MLIQRFHTQNPISNPLLQVAELAEGQSVVLYYPQLHVTVDDYFGSLRNCVGQLGMNSQPDRENMLKHVKSALVIVSSVGLSPMKDLSGLNIWHGSFSRN